MATKNTGFRAVQTMGGPNCPVLREFEVYASSNTEFFPGDVVTLRTDGKVDQSVATSGANLLGVVDSCFRKTATGERMPLTFNQPTRGPYLASGQAGYVLVNIDPDQLYEVAIGVSASAGIVGKTAAVSAGTPNRAVGRSGMTLSGSLQTTQDRPFKILGLAPRELVTGRGEKPEGTYVLVKPNTSVFSKIAGV